MYILLILYIINMHLFLFFFFLKNKTGHKKKETLPRSPTTAFLERSRRDLSGKQCGDGRHSEHMGQARASLLNEVKDGKMRLIKTT